MHNHKTKGLTYENKSCLPSMHVKYVVVYTNSFSSIYLSCYEKILSNVYSFVSFFLFFTSFVFMQIKSSLIRF